jgi:hypothetical protein
MTDAIKNNARAIARQYNREILCVADAIHVGQRNRIWDLTIDTTNWSIRIQDTSDLNWDEARRFADTLECARCIVGVMNIGK